VPAIGYYLGVALALALLLYGIVRCWARRESAVLAGLGAVVLAYGAARVGGTPYTAAKAIEVASPILALTILLPLGWHTIRLPAAGAIGDALSEGASTAAETPGSRAVTGPAGGRLVFALFVLAAGACSLLALVNAPIGPTAFSPALHDIRPLIAADSTLALASAELLSEEHGGPFLSWELRGGRVCVESGAGAGKRPPRGVRFVLVRGEPGQPPFRGLRVRRVAPPYVLWESTRPVLGHGPCPLIAERQARQSPAR
jgi:hypothetical protein